MGETVGFVESWDVSSARSCELINNSVAAEPDRLNRPPFILPQTATAPEFLCDKCIKYCRLDVSRDFQRLEDASEDKEYVHQFFQTSGPCLFVGVDHAFSVCNGLRCPVTSLFTPTPTGTVQITRVTLSSTWRQTLSGHPAWQPLPSFGAAFFKPRTTPKVCELEPSIFERVCEARPWCLTTQHHLTFRKLCGNILSWKW